MTWAAREERAEVVKGKTGTAAGWGEENEESQTVSRSVTPQTVSEQRYVPDVHVFLFHPDNLQPRDTGRAGR